MNRKLIIPVRPPLITPSDGIPSVLLE